MKIGKVKTIWFDFDNSPHVPVLMPIAEELKRRGYELFCTGRDVAQTQDLLKLHGIDADVIGREFSAKKHKKVTSTLFRALRLSVLLKKKNISCCISHSSRSAILAGWLLKKPVLAMFDYEHVNSSFQKFFADVILMPQAVSKNIALPKIQYYPGIKEQFYLKDFVPKEDPFETLGIPCRKIRVVLRLPPQFSHYHAHRTDEVLSEILSFLKDVPEVYLVVFPRNKNQGKEYGLRLQELGCDFVVVDRVFNGGDIVFFADAVFSGGGTMAREAAVLGVPSYSFFMGLKGAVDEFLERAGRLTFIRSKQDFKKINLQKRSYHKANFLPCEGDGIAFTVKAIETLMK